MAAGIGAGSDDFAITVFLHKLTITDIVQIITFETHALLIFLNGSAIAFAIFESSLEFRTVGIAGYALTVDLAVFELALKHVSSLRRELAFAIRSIGFPKTYVLIAILPDHRTLSLLVAFVELAHVFIAIGILRNTSACALAINIVAFVNVAVLELIDTTTILHVILPLTDIYIARRIFKGALALTDVVHPLSLIRGTIAPVEITLAILLVIFPVSFVIGTVGKGVHTLSRTLVHVPVPVVFVAIEIIHDTVTMLIVAEPEALVAVVVGEIIHALAVLLVLKPLALVFLTIEEGVGADALTLAFLVLPLIPVAVLIGGLTLTMRLSLKELALKLTAILRRTRAERDFLR